MDLNNVLIDRGGELLTYRLGVKSLAEYYRNRRIDSLNFLSDFESTDLMTCALFDTKNNPFIGIINQDIVQRVIDGTDEVFNDKCIISDLTGTNREVLINDAYNCIKQSLKSLSVLESLYTTVASTPLGKNVSLNDFKLYLESNTDIKLSDPDIANIVQLINSGNTADDVLVAVSNEAVSSINVDDYSFNANEFQLSVTVGIVNYVAKTTLEVVSALKKGWGLLGVVVDASQRILAKGALRAISEVQQADVLNNYDVIDDITQGYFDIPMIESEIDLSNTFPSSIWSSGDAIHFRNYSIDLLNGKMFSNGSTYLDILSSKVNWREPFYKEIVQPGHIIRFWKDGSSFTLKYQILLSNEYHSDADDMLSSITYNVLPTNRSVHNFVETMTNVTAEWIGIHPVFDNSVFLVTTDDGSIPGRWWTRATNRSNIFYDESIFNQSNNTPQALVSALYYSPFKNKSGVIWDSIRNYCILKLFESTIGSVVSDRYTILQNDYYVSYITSYTKPINGYYIPYYDSEHVKAKIHAETTNETVREIVVTTYTVIAVAAVIAATITIGLLARRISNIRLASSLNAQRYIQAYADGEIPYSQARKYFRRYRRLFNLTTAISGTSPLIETTDDDLLFSITKLIKG